MILDYDKLRYLLKDTPLQGLSDEQLYNVAIGEYPIMFGSKQFDRIWWTVIGSDKYQTELLRVQEAKDYLSSFRTKSIKNKNTEVVDQLDTIESTINRMLEILATNEILSTMQLSQERELVSYEIKLRELREQNKRLKDGL